MFISEEIQVPFKGAVNTVFMIILAAFTTLIHYLDSYLVRRNLVNMYIYVHIYIFTCNNGMIVIYIYIYT
jgi:hypothetical protein